MMTTEEYDRDDTPIPALMTVAQAAQHLGVTRQAVQRKIDRGTLSARQVGTHWVIPARAIDRDFVEA